MTLASDTVMLPKCVRELLRQHTSLCFGDVVGSVSGVDVYLCVFLGETVLVGICVWLSIVCPRRSTGIT
jgi:hypothetical protein